MPNRVQVEALANGEVVDGPVAVTINVVDVNNNAPYFNQSSYTATVRERSSSGELLRVLMSDTRRGNVVVQIKISHTTFIGINGWTLSKISHEPEGGCELNYRTVMIGCTTK